MALVLLLMLLLLLLLLLLMLQLEVLLLPPNIDGHMVHSLLQSPPLPGFSHLLK